MGPNSTLASRSLVRLRSRLAPQDPTGGLIDVHSKVATDGGDSRCIEIPLAPEGFLAFFFLGYNDIVSLVVVALRKGRSGITMKWMDHLPSSDSYLGRFIIGAKKYTLGL